MAPASVIPRPRPGRNARRDRRLMAAFGAIGLAAVLAVGLRIANAEPAASDVIRVTTSPVDGVVDISFGGDTFLGAFSLGNFVFGTPGRFDTFGQVGQGLTATVRFTGDAHGNLTFTCLDTDNTAVKYVSRPCTATTVKTAQATVGPAVTWNGNTGQLPF